MKKFAGIVYAIKILLFIVHFYFVFIMLHNILDTNIYGIIFIIMYLILSFKTIIEIVFKDKYYKEDIIYNFMQIGFLIYLLIVSFKTNVAKVYVTRLTVSYFRINYIILSILIGFILIYSLLEKLDRKKLRQH